MLHYFSTKPLWKKVWTFNQANYSSFESPSFINGLIEVGNWLYKFGFDIPFLSPLDSGFAWSEEVCLWQVSKQAWSLN